MAIRSTFYDTTPEDGVKETEWAQSALSRGPLYGVVGPDDLKLTAHPTTPYAVNIGPGKFFGHGVWDDSDATEVVQCATPAAGSTRWDLIVGRRDWQPAGGGPTSLRAISGTATLALPAGRETRPGVLDDQPVWLIQWKAGLPQPQQIIDLRCWAGPGGVEAAHKLALSYLAEPGAAVKIGSTVWRYELQGNGVWDWSDGRGVKTLIPLTYLYSADPPRGDRLAQEPPSVYKDRHRVHLSGVASNIGSVEYTGGVEYSLGRLPEGFRPAVVEYFTVEAAFTLCRVWVRPDGNIYFMFPVKVGPLASRLWRFSLSGISFDAAP